MIFGAALAAGPASAICDVIPGAAAEFRSALGATNRPYAGPGDFLEVAVRPAVCDDESTGLGPQAPDNLVTVLFTPPGALVSAVVLASDCGLLGAGTCVGGGAPGAPCRTSAECSGGSCSGPSALAACQAQLGGGGSASCVTAGADDLAIERDGVSERLTFRFPDTDFAVDGPSDDRTLAGPATVVVTPDTKPLACGAALQPCAALPRQSAAACIDRFFALDGSCGTASSQLARPFSGFTALPNSNDYQKLCESSDPSSPCTPDPALEVRFTIDREGNVLVPMNWRGVRLFRDGNPVARLAEGETSIDAFVTGLLAGTPIDVPGDSFVASFSPNGFPVAPAFTPVADEDDAAAKLFGSVDADRGVMRIARRGVSLRECLDASGLPPAPAGIPCNDAEDCPAGLSCGDPGEAFCRNRATQVRGAQSCAADGVCSAAGQECGPALFAFEGRGTGQGKGPVVIPNADFEATVGTPVPLEGLLESDEVFAFGLSEPLDGEDRNGDLDAVDFIATLGDKQGGLGALLSPVVRLRDGRFRYPALDVEADILAYLEPEQGRLFEFEGAIPSPACILNDDGDCFDSLPRVFRQPDGGAPPEEIFVGTLPADALPIVNGKSIAIMDGRVFFRSPEPDQAPRLLERQSLLPGGAPSGLPATPEDVSADGTRVAFASQGRLVAAKLGGQRDGFVRDRSTGEMIWASVDRFGGDPNGTLRSLRLSGDGQHAFFDSDATDLVEETEGDDSDLRRLFVRDLAAGVTSLLEIGGDGLPSADAFLEDVSADGRFVAFRSAASELFGGDPVPGDVHVYRFDRETGATDLVDARSGSPASGDAEDAGISDDGRFVAFVSTATDLLEDGLADANGAAADVFVRDMGSDRVELASVGTGGSPQANGPSVAVSLSPDGRTVAFSAFATNLDAHVTPGFGSTVYVRDRSADVTFAVQQLAGPVGATPSLGGAGRYLGATSDVLLGLNPFLVARSLFRGDLLTGIVELVDALGLEDFIVLERSVLSGDGHTSLFSDLSPVPALGAFVKSFDAAAPSADFSGDGDARDTLLVTVDTGDGGGTDVLCPAAKVDLGDGFALFLRPERDGESPENPVCPSASGLPGDFSGDGDLLDQVAHLRRPDEGLRNLELAARDVAVTGSVAAALGSESDERRPGQSDAEASFNGDDDALDDVLFVAPVDDVSGREDWTVVPRAGKALDASGDLVGILSCEADQGGDTTDDEDSSDCSIQLYDGIALSDPSAGGLLDLSDAEGRQRPADDFVMGSAGRRCVAPASPATACSESADCPAGSFCGAAAACIAVLAEPASCSGDGDCAAGASCERDLVVAFRGTEADLCNAPPLACGAGDVPPGCDDVAECDRNGDGDCCDDALFAFDLLQGRVVASGQAITPCQLQACDPRLPYRVFTPSATVRFLTLEADQGGQDLDADGAANGLVVQVWNVRGGAVETVATVSNVSDPGPNDPTVDPLAGGSELEPGTQIFSSFGLCIETLGEGPCPPDGFLEDGACRVVHGVCASEGDCPPGIPCDRTRRITVAVADEDGDGLPDPIDNCPGAINSDQTDEDGDEQGDACDARICGDGDLDPGEQCDDADLEDGDGCSRFCQSERRICDANGDGSVDQRDISKILRDRGQTAVQPYDPRDVDLDGQITVLDSRTCVRECDRTNCAAPPPPAPGPPGCGLLGGEALLALLPLWLWRRRAAARRAGLALAAALALVLVGGAPASAVTLSLVPSAVEVAVGGGFDLDLMVGGLGNGVAPSLGGFDVALSFDANLLSLDSVVLGGPLGDEGSFESFSDVVFATGSVSIAQTSFLDALVLDTIQPASFKLASLSFTALAAGTSSVAFASASLADAFGAPLAVAVAGAQVNAAGVIPEPSAGLLFGLGAFAVASAAGRSRRAR